MKLRQRTLPWDCQHHCGTTISAIYLRIQRQSLVFEKSSSYPSTPEAAASRGLRSLRLSQKIHWWHRRRGLECDFHLSPGPTPKSTTASNTPLIYGTGSSLNRFLSKLLITLTLWELCHSPKDLLTLLQAHRIITQVVLTGSRVLGRAFAEAYRQAAASQKYAGQAAKNNPGATNNLPSSGLTLDEACKILNVKPPQGGKANMEDVMERFKKLFDVNDPKKGGSFYLQSKVLRARERIELEVREAEGMSEREQELKEGWKPKVYKERWHRLPVGENGRGGVPCWSRVPESWWSFEPLLVHQPGVWLFIASSFWWNASSDCLSESRFACCLAWSRALLLVSSSSWTVEFVNCWRACFRCFLACWSSSSLFQLSWLSLWSV